MRQSSFGQKKEPWLERFLMKRRANRIIKELKSLNKLEAITDLGSGFNATFLIEVLKSFPQIKTATAIDLKVAPEALNKKINILAADLNAPLPLPDASFDAVVCSAVIEHLSNWQMALSEMHRILKSGGYLFLTSPSPQLKTILELLAFKLRLLDPVEIADHKNYFSATRLKQELAALNFKNIKTRAFQLGLNTLAVAQK